MVKKFSTAMIKKYFPFSFIPLFFIAVAFIAGCSAPIGGLEVDNPHYIRAMPKKFLYALDDYFIVKDVDVIDVFGGRERLIDINDNGVEIKIIESPLLSGEPVLIDKIKGHPLKSKGVNTIVISYMGMVTRYSIQVAAPGEVPGWNGDGETSIIIKWL